VSWLRGSRGTLSVPVDNHKRSNSRSRPGPWLLPSANTALVATRAVILTKPEKRLDRSSLNFPGAVDAAVGPIALEHAFHRVQ